MSTTTIVKCDRCLNKIADQRRCRVAFAHDYQPNKAYDLCATCAKAVIVTIVTIVGEREVPTKHD